MLGNGLGGMMKYAQKIQAEIKDTQEKLKNEVVVGTAGGGAIKVTSNGHQEILKVEINEELIGEDVDLLEDLVLTAANDALNKSKELAQEKMNKITGGIKVPGMDLLGGLLK